MGKASRRKQRTPSAAAEGPWPLTNASTQRQIEAWFAQRGIDPSRPGLHDTPQFLAAEAQDPKALNLVARLVEARSYSLDELAQAEQKILIAAQAVANRVAGDGRHGLCVVASGILSRMLDVLGIWNYTAKTNLTIHFPRAVSAEPRHFYSIDEGNFVAPHAIVVTPPFSVVDVTVKHQFYDAAPMALWLPSMVAAKGFRPYRLTLAELVSPSAQAEMAMNGDTIEQYLSRDRGNMLDFMKQIPAREVSLDGGRLGYGLVAAGGYQEQLADLNSEHCSIDGLTPLEIFEQDVLPQL